MVQDFHKDHLKGNIDNLKEFDGKFWTSCSQSVTNLLSKNSMLSIAVL